MNKQKIMPLRSPNDDVLVEAEGVSKKFCRSLKKSLLYGISDIFQELNPFRERQKQALASNERELTHSKATRTVETNESNNLPKLRPSEFWAVQDVSFQLRRGECLGLIGHNGAGKTTLLKMLNGLIKPDSGRITIRGQVGALIALGAGFNPILTGRENIYVNASLLGLSKKDIDKKIHEIIDFSEIGDFIDSPVQNYSSGMSVRLGFAIATSLNPDVLILDEVLAVGDAAFRVKCYKRVDSIRRNCAMIFVSHDMPSVGRICSSAMHMVHGRVEAHGDVMKTIESYNIAGYSKNSQNAVHTVFDPIQNVTPIHFPTEMTSTDSCSLVLKVISREAVDSFAFVLHVRDMHEEYLLSRVFLPEEHCIKLKQGETIFRINLHSIPLRSGQYSLHFEMGDTRPGKSGSLATLIHFHKFSITDGNNRGVAKCMLPISSVQYI